MQSLIYRFYFVASEKCSGSEEVIWQLGSHSGFHGNGLNMVTLTS